MNIKIITIAMLVVLSFISCTGIKQQENTESSTKEAVKNTVNEIVQTTVTDKNGKNLVISFNNTNGTAVLEFNGETIELLAQKSASGIWYKNENYELRGKGNDIELRENGNIIFTHKDNIVTTSLKNKEGETLDMTFNNSTNTVKVYLNGGEQIEMFGQNPASGIWYKNNDYELRGKAEDVVLTKDGKTVFKN